MKSPRQRLESLLELHDGRCAVGECSDLAIIAYDMEKEKIVKVSPQIGDVGSYKMIVVERNYGTLRNKNS